MSSSSEDDSDDEDDETEGSIELYGNKHKKIKAESTAERVKAETLKSIQIDIIRINSILANVSNSLINIIP